MVVTNQHVVRVVTNQLVRMAAANQHVVMDATNQRVQTLAMCAMVLLVALPAYQVEDIINMTTLRGLAVHFIAIKLVRMVVTNQHAVMVAVDQHVVMVAVNQLVRMAATKHCVAIPIMFAHLKFVYYVIKDNYD